MAKVTVVLNERISRWARSEAAKRGLSLSAWINQWFRREAAPGRIPATKHQMNTLTRFLDGPGYPGLSADLPSRDQIHDRSTRRKRALAHPKSRPGKSGKTG